MNAIFWGGCLRFGQGLLSAAPTILVGLFVAGMLRHIIGPELTRRAFGGRSWKSLPAAWMWGMLLPVCSFGVIPILCELRRARLSAGTIFAFAISAPLFNPLSLLYGLTLSTPMAILSFAISSLVVVTLVGTICDLITSLPNNDSEQPSLTMPPGWKRLVAVLILATRHAYRGTIGYIGLGLLASSLLVVAYPFGSLSSSMGYGDPWAPLQMLCLAVPAYATPLTVMMQVGSMFVHGNSPGAAYVLLSVGAGMNVGLLAWALVHFGLRRTLAFVTLTLVVIIVIAYGIETPLYSAGSVDHPHTHAFDMYACPYPANTRVSLPQTTWLKLTENLAVHEEFSFIALALLIVAGAILQTCDPKERLEKFLASESELQGTAKPRRDKDVPAPVLGVVVFAGLIAISLIGCFAYYPPPDQTLEDMRYVQADALSYASSRDREEALRSIAMYDELTRKLQVGHYLRHGHVTPFQRMRAKVLRGRLEQLKDFIESHQYEQVRDAIPKVADAFRRCREAFEPLSTQVAQ